MTVTQNTPEALAYLNRRLKALRDVIRDRGFEPEAFMFVSHAGDDFNIVVEARKPGQPIYETPRLRECFRGAAGEIEQAFDRAASWVYNLPTTDEQHLNELIAQLHKTIEIARKGGVHAGDQQMQRAWDAVADELKRFSEEIRQNGLPAPYSQDHEGDGKVVHISNIAS